MLYTIAVILLILWLLGFVSGYTIGAFIHVLLVVAVVAVTAANYRSVGLGAAVENAAATAKAKPLAAQVNDPEPRVLPMTGARDVTLIALGLLILAGVAFGIRVATAEPGKPRKPAEAGPSDRRDQRKELDA